MEQTRFSKYVQTIGLTEAIELVLADPSVHFFTKDTIRHGLSIDPLDAFYDVKLALEVLEAHLQKVTDQGMRVTVY